jgi:hypothetical protein
MILCTKVPNCTRNHYAKGYCYNHYTQARRRGIDGNMADLSCSVMVSKMPPCDDKCLYSVGCEGKQFWFGACHSCRNEVMMLEKAEPGTFVQLQAAGRLSYERENNHYP